MIPTISFEAHQVIRPELDYDKVIPWLSRVIEQENKSLGSIDYIFCDDAFLHKINTDFLKHDTYTDIITFPYSYDPIESEIYISLERVRENAEIFGDGDYKAELQRVIVHGLLHMCGHYDRTDDEKVQMRQLESKYLALMNSH